MYKVLISVKIEDVNAMHDVGWKTAKGENSIEFYCNEKNSIEQFSQHLCYVLRSPFIPPFDVIEICKGGESIGHGEM